MSCKQEEPIQLEHAANCKDGRTSPRRRWSRSQRGALARGGAAPDLAEEWKDLTQAQKMEHLRVEVRTLYVEMQQAAQRQDIMQQTMVQMLQMLAQMEQMLVQQQLQPVPQPPAPPPAPPSAVQQPAAAPPPPALPPPAAAKPPPPTPPPAEMAVYKGPHQCNFHSQQALANLQTVDISGGQLVHDPWQFDKEFSSMQATLFADDHRGDDELWGRLKSDFLNGKVSIVCARTHSGATRFWHTKCNHCLQFNHVEYGSWACKTLEDKARARQQLFLWHCPPIESAPQIAPGAALPAGRPQV